MTEQIGLQAVLEISDFLKGIQQYISGSKKMEDSTSNSEKAFLTLGRAEAQLSQSIHSMSASIDVGRASIDMLNQSFEKGEISEETYTKAMRAVQQQFGLITPESDELAQKISELDAAFKRGDISAEQYAKELKTATDNSKKFKEGTDEASQSMSDFLKSMSSDIARGAMERIGQLLTDFASRLPQIAMEIVDLGVQLQSTRHRFESFAGGPEEAAKYLDAFAVASGGAIDQMSAMRGATKLLQMGLVANSDEMELMAKIALHLGDQTADTGDRINDFALLLANQSVMRLDNFGISSGRVRQRIEELQAATKNMTREEAFKIAVMEQGKLSLEKIGDTSGSTANQIMKLKAAVQDAKIGLGDLAVSSIAADEGMSKLLDSLAEHIRSTPQMITTFNDVLQIFGKAKYGALSWGDALDQASLIADHFISGIEGVESHIDQINKAKEDDISRWQQYATVIADSTDIAVNAISNVSYVTEELTTDTDNLTLSDGELLHKVMAATNELNLQKEALGLAESATWSEVLAVQELNATQAAAKLAVDEHNLALNNLAMTLMDATSKELAKTAIDELTKAHQAGKLTTEEYNAAVKDVALSFGLANAESYTLASGIKTLAEDLIAGKIPSDQMAEALALLALDASNAAAQADAAARAITGIPDRTVSINYVYTVTGSPPDEESHPEQVPGSGGSDSGYGGATPGMAEGGIATGGMTLVGERGPELVNLPRGASVMNATDTNKLFKSVLSMMRSNTPVSQVANSNRTITVPINATINNGMDMFAFQARVQQAITGAL